MYCISTIYILWIDNSITFYDVWAIYKKCHRKFGYKWKFLILNSKKKKKSLIDEVGRMLLTSNLSIKNVEIWSVGYGMHAVVAVQCTVWKKNKELDFFFSLMNAKNLLIRLNAIGRSIRKVITDKPHVSSNHGREI